MIFGHFILLVDCLNANERSTRNNDGHFDGLSGFRTISSYSTARFRNPLVAGIDWLVRKQYYNGCLWEFLPPANEVWGKVMFLLESVILSIGGRGLCLGVSLDRDPLDRDHPDRDPPKQRPPDTDPPV